MAHLKEICEEDRLHYELSRELLSLTRQQRSSARRAGLFDKFEKTFSKHFYDDEADALARAQKIATEREAIKNKALQGPASTRGQDEAEFSVTNTDQI